MSESTIVLSDAERDELMRLAPQDNLDGKRASALLSLAAGTPRAEAAAAAGLSSGQIDYAVKRFRQERLGLFASATVAAEAPPTRATPQPTVATKASTEAQATSSGADDTSAQLRQLVKELNDLVSELHQTVPTGKSAAATNGRYSPVGLLTLLRDNVQKLAPDVQSGMLQSFQGMTAEDLLDKETWKGMAYMLTYSARFQAEQVAGKVNETINEVVPEPVQPSRLWEKGKNSLDKLTPDFAKQIFSMFEGAKPRDLVDPDTWKGLWHMLNYSLQFQAEQLKQRLTESGEKH